jgi:hypothetical protein
MTLVWWGYTRVLPRTSCGMVVVEGHRPQSQYLSGGPLNVLCSDRYTDLGEARPIRTPGWTCGHLCKGLLQLCTCRNCIRKKTS